MSQSDADFIASVCSVYPSFSKKDVLRFLAANNTHSKARLMIDTTARWRKETRPEQVTQALVSSALDGGCWRLLGTTTTGYPVVWVQLSLWDPSKYDVELYRMHAIYWLEHLGKIGERFTVLFDLSGWKLSFATEIRKIAALAATLQSHYPERLEAALMLRAPFVFSSAWTLIRPLLAPVTAAKITFVPTRQETQVLAGRGIGLEIVPSLYGGSRRQPVPFPNLPGECDLSGLATSPLAAGKTISNAMFGVESSLPEEPWQLWLSIAAAAVPVLVLLASLWMSV